jgi:hypothetical protein
LRVASGSIVVRTVFGRFLTRATFLFLAVSGGASCASADDAPQPTIAVVNLNPDDIGSVGKMAGTLGYQLASSPPDAQDHPEKMVFLEVASTGKARQAFTAEAAARWMSYVQQGGRLLVGFEQRSLVDVMRLAPMLPTVAWRATQDVLGPNHLAESDPDFFPDAKAVAGLSVPFYFPIRPWLAVERGQARYDRFDRQIGARLDETTILPAGTEWWTRPLLSREWTVRARGADVAASPLLLTGRYGAGRVAVFASSLESTTGPQADAFWTQVIQWLGKDDPATQPDVPVTSPLVVTVSGEPSNQPRGGMQQSLIDLASGTAKLAPIPDLNTVSPGNLVVSIQNPNPQAIHVKIVARLLSWEHAMIEDRLADATLAGGGLVTQVKLPLPVPSAISYQEITVRPAFDVRLGVLSESGSTLLSETKTAVDVTPPVTLSVHTEELRTLPFPFPTAARPDKQMEGRNGMPVYSYAYLPGSTVQATIKVSNGVRNIAPLATISDVDEPDNKTVSALNTGFTGDHGPDWFLPSTWTYFETTKSNSATLKLSFPTPVTVTGVTLWGAANDFRKMDRRNPEEAVISQNGKELAREPNLLARFKAETGQVHISFAPVKLQELTVTLTKTSMATNELELGQLEVEGAAEPPAAPVQGKLSLFLTNALTGEVTPVHAEDVTLAPLEEKKITVPVILPGSPNAEFYRLNGVFLGANGTNPATNSFPLMTVSGKEPVLLSMDSLENMPFDSGYPSGASLGFIVTRGFRNVFENAVGTAEMGGGWGQPDDLVWAYAHGFKQEGRPKAQANRLYVTSTDMRHYSTPWRQFYNGEEFYDIATPLLVDRMKEQRNYTKSDIVVLAHSDRWDTGPQIGSNHTWQDFEGFNAWLLAQHLPPLQGRTLMDLTAEIATEPRTGLWYSWQLERYVANIRNLRDSFAREGKKLLITAQGMPVLPSDEAPEIDAVVRGSSDDNTWGEAALDLIYSTGRQMGTVALNPTLAMSTLNEWQWLSSLLGNAQWRGSVGTTEPARRRQYDRAFRGALRPDGAYGAMSIYGYNTNGGLAYTLNEVDYNQWEQTMVKQSLLFPSGPIGAGVIVSNARYEKPENALFDCGDGSLFPEAHLVQDAVRRLSYAGISVSFSGNAGLLAGWKNQAPLVLLNLQDFGDAEQATVSKMAAAGRPIVVFQGPGTSPLSAGTAALFGVAADGTPADGKEVARIQDRPVVQKGSCLYVPVEVGKMTQEEADALAPILRKALAQVLTFPDGTTGYGFVSNGRNFAVVEDWREEGRMAELRVKADPRASALLAVNTNSNRPLQTMKEGTDWVIRLPLRPGDGLLVTFKEISP